MIKMTPTQRMEWLLGRAYLAQAHATTAKLLAQYECFLRATNAEEGELITRFLDKDTSREYIREAYEFGDLVFDVLTSIGAGNRFYRLLVV
jgi:hypothetical protein